ncbi:hypothetical protein CTAYLR_005736 [Chrysophaeum taylorii]|uniref:Major facilitator superfamily (MFS) profile domain-containing protein n=1 Tax=Chrysophaeum taylorii TaxID=2483200 RepID=A0AAD7UKQ1_9STRA|nr:hypothetical protein CTAYLR_005736 [Chrysophaeum taylorii]
MAETTPTHSAEAALETLHVLDGRRLGAFQKRLVWVTVLALAGDAAEIVLVVLLSACADPSGGATFTAQLGAAACAGQLLGAAFFGSAADAHGRRRLFVASGAIVALGGLLSAAAPARVATLAALRGVVGFGVGGGAALSAVLMVEYLPVHGRGRMLLIVRALSTAGGLYVTLCAWLVLGSRGWRALAVMAAVPAVASALIARSLLPESPRWLQRRGRAHEAAAVVARVAADNGVELPPGALRLCTPARRHSAPFFFQGLLGANNDEQQVSLLEHRFRGDGAARAFSDDAECGGEEDDDDDNSSSSSASGGETSEDLRCCCCCGAWQARDDGPPIDEALDREYGVVVAVRDDDEEDERATGEDASFFGNETNTDAPPAQATRTLTAYGAATATAALRAIKLRPRPPRCSLCRRLNRCKVRRCHADDGVAVARALRLPNDEPRRARVALWVGTLGRRTAPLWVLSILLGGAYLATATLSSLLFARVTKEDRPEDVDDCAMAFDYRGLAVGSVTEAAAATLASVVVDGGRRRLLASLLAAAATELALLCFPLSLLATALVALIARAALFAAGAVAFAAELYPTEVRATGAAHAAGCSRLGGAFASLLVVARFSDTRLATASHDLTSLVGPLALTALLAALTTLLIPVETAQKPAVEAPLLAVAPPKSRRRRSRVSDLPPPDDPFKSPFAPDAQGTTTSPPRRSLEPDDDDTFTM